MATTRYSKQREAIRDYLMSTYSHPTAEEVYHHLRELYPNVSLGTVYRNLNYLVENKEALRLDCGDGTDHFDGNTMPHYHFFCKKCGCILDLHMDSIEHINLIAAVGFKGEIEGHTTFFYGICPHCKTGENNYY